MVDLATYPAGQKQSMPIEYKNNLKKLIDAYMAEREKSEHARGNTEYTASLSQFCEETGMSWGTIQRWTHGYIKRPDLEIVAQLSEILGCGIEDIFVKTYVPPRDKKKSSRD